MASQFGYFIQITLFVLFLYVSLLAVFLCIRRQEVKIRRENEPPDRQLLGEVQEEIERQSIFTFFWTTQVDDTFDSCIHKKARPFLLAVRIIAWLFVFFSGIIVPAVQDKIAFYFFDGWTIILALFYYTGVITLTFMAIYTLRQRSLLMGDGSGADLGPGLGGPLSWTFYPRLVAVICHLLFEVVGASLIASLFLDIEGFQSKSTVLTMQTKVIFSLFVLEMAMNNLRVRFDQMPAAVAWMMSYLIIIWPAVFSGSMKTWPYSQMRMDDQQCFMNYTLIFVGMIGCYSLWYMIYKVKKMLMHWHAVRMGTRSQGMVLSDHAVMASSLDQEEGGGVGNGGESGEEGLALAQYSYPMDNGGDGGGYYDDYAGQSDLFTAYNPVLSYSPNSSFYYPPQTTNSYGPSSYFDSSSYWQDVGYGGAYGSAYGYGYGGYGAGYEGQGYYANYGNYATAEVAPVPPAPPAPPIYHVDHQSELHGGYYFPSIYGFQAEAVPQPTASFYGNDGLNNGGMPPPSFVPPLPPAPIGPMTRNGVPPPPIDTNFANDSFPPAPPSTTSSGGNKERRRVWDTLPHHNNNGATGGSGRGNSRGGTRNPLYRRRPHPAATNSPTVAANIERLQRTPTAMFGNQDEDVQSFAQSFGED